MKRSINVDVSDALLGSFILLVVFFMIPSAIATKLPRTIDPVGFVHDHLESDEQYRFMQMAKHVLSKDEYCAFLREMHSRYSGIESTYLVLYAANMNTCCEVLEYIDTVDIQNRLQSAVSKLERSRINTDSVENSDSLKFRDEVIDIDNNIIILREYYDVMFQEYRELRKKCNSNANN